MAKKKFPSNLLLLPPPPPEEEIARRDALDAEGKQVKAFNFSAGAKKQKEIIFDPQQYNLTQTIELSEAAISKRNYTQIQRPYKEKTHIQGHDGFLFTENFAASAPGKLDLLIVIDDSSTMEPIQNSISQALPPLLSALDNVDWQIVVNTTSSPCLRQTSSGKTALTKANYEIDAAQVIADYQELITPETNPSVEMGMRSAGEGLLGICLGETSPWRRSDAKPAVLIISDERNCGGAPNESCPAEYAESLYPEYVTERVPNVRAYGLLMLSYADPDCPDNGYNTNWDPVQYKSLIDSTGGIYAKICQQSYDNVLQQISEDVSKVIFRSYTLSQAPDTTPSLTLDDQGITPAISVSGNILTINEALPDTAKNLAISYYQDPAPRTDTYTLPQGADYIGLIVEVNGSISDQYKYDSAENAITFSTSPPDAAKIILKYHEKGLLKTKFDFASNAILNTVEVRVGGQRQSSHNYQLSDSHITLAQPPLDGQSIELSYRTEQDKKTRYSLQSLTTRRTETVEAFDDTSGIPISISVENNDIVFKKHDVWQGRQVKLVIDLVYEGDDLNYNLPLKHTPLPGSVTLLNADTRCKAKHSINTELNIECTHDGTEPMKITYDYAESFTNTFALDITENDLSSILVYIDGNQTKNYAILDKSTLNILDKKLKVGSQVKIIVIPNTSKDETIN